MLFPYLVLYFVSRPVIFLRRWYLDASLRFWATVLENFTKLDRIFAIKIMIQTIGLPLYGDYSIVGRILGPIFRTGRIMIALPIYILYFSFFAFLWVLWVSLPIYLVAKALGIL
jgi:hypothetical protein